MVEDNIKLSIHQHTLSKTLELKLELTPRIGSFIKQCLEFK